MNNHKNPKLGRYVLQSKLILDLNNSSVWANFISLGRSSQSFGPKILRDFIP